MLAPPFWEVRYAMFGGDVVERAEEWRVAVTDDGSVRAMTPRAARGACRRAPDARRGAGARAARAARRASTSMRRRCKLVAADEQQRPARTDWSFVFGDPRIVVGAGGEARYVVAIAGDEVVGCRALRARARDVDARRSASATTGCRSLALAGGRRLLRRRACRARRRHPRLDQASRRCARCCGSCSPRRSSIALLSAVNAGRRSRCGFRRPSRSRRS